MNKRQKPNRRLASELVQNVRAGRMNAKTLAALTEAMAEKMVADLPFFRWERIRNCIVGSHGHQTIALDLKRRNSLGSVADANEITITIFEFNPEQSRACYEAAQEAVGEIVVKA